MRVFVKATNRMIPETESDYTAYLGFEEMGYKPILFNARKELDACTPTDLIVGGVSLIDGILERYGIEAPQLDYPTELAWLLGRRIWMDSLRAVVSLPEMRPVFVKPVKNKAFTGFVFRKESDIPRLRGQSMDMDVYCSEPVTFESEWRVFVRYGKICDVRPYRGDWKALYNAGTIELAVQRFNSAPAGYALDIGVTKTGQNILIEVNDGYALGAYGLERLEYARLLSARWCELMGIHDECDIYKERIDWKASREAKR